MLKPRLRPLTTNLPAICIGSGGGTRTHDLRVMSPASCRCSTPRRQRIESALTFCGGNGLVVKPSAISTAQLSRLPGLHMPPIKRVVFPRPYPVTRWETSSWGGASHLDAFSAYPVRTWLLGFLLLAEQPTHQRSVHPGPLVLGAAPRRFPAPTADRDRTVSRRSEPSSRAALMGEQPNPWDLLQPQDATSRHRGAKPPRRCERLGEISLLSPG